VFTTTGKSPVSGFSKIKARLDRAMLAAAAADSDSEKPTIPPWRLHDLRRTAVTGMAELGIAPHVIEAVVNHVSGARAGVAGIYNRSKLISERRAALDRWTSHVGGVVSGKAVNVVPLRREV